MRAQRRTPMRTRPLTRLLRHMYTRAPVEERGIGGDALRDILDATRSYERLQMT
jgi:hypothetical protein